MSSKPPLPPAEPDYGPTGAVHDIAIYCVLALATVGVIAIVAAIAFELIGRLL